jgi:16S rRNA processing protein RimM
MASSKNKIIAVGKVATAHKLSGELKIQLSIKVYLKTQKPKVVFIGNDETNALPYQVLIFKATQAQQYIIQVEGISTREAAMKLSSQKIFLQSKDAQLEDAEIDNGLIGFTIIDTKLNIKGIVTDVYNLPGQTMISFATIAIKEVLLPATTATIKTIHYPSKTIEVELPDGLLEIFE